MNSPLEGVGKSIRIIADHLREEENFLAIKNDWKFIAMVVDRCLFWLFILIRTVVEILFKLMTLKI